MNIAGESGNNFKAFTTVQQNAVREVLQNYASVANVTFTEITETVNPTCHFALRRIGFTEHCLGVLSEHFRSRRRCLVR